MKAPFCFAHCEHCHAFWGDVVGEFVVHRCSKQDGQTVRCIARLALDPAKVVEKVDSGITRLERKERDNGECR